jgi:hypothetical protein
MALQMVFKAFRLLVTYERAQQARVLHNTWLERMVRKNTLAYQTHL